MCRCRVGLGGGVVWIMGQVILIESRDRESLFCLKPVHIETESSGNKKCLIFRRMSQKLKSSRM